MAIQKTVIKKENITADTLAELLSEPSLADFNGTLNIKKLANGKYFVQTDYVDEEGVQLQDKTFEENGVYTAGPGFDGLGTVTVAVQSGEPAEIKLKDITITEDGVYTVPEGYDGFGVITVVTSEPCGVCEDACQTVCQDCQTGCQINCMNCLSCECEIEGCESCQDSCQIACQSSCEVQNQSLHANHNSHVSSYAPSHANYSYVPPHANYSSAPHSNHSSHNSHSSSYHEPHVSHVNSVEYNYNPSHESHFNYHN